MTVRPTPCTNPLEDSEKTSIPSAGSSHSEATPSDLKVLVSFCVFGNDLSQIYVPGAVRNVQLYTRYHPGWKVRLYGSEGTARAILDVLPSAPNLEVVVMDGPEDQTATLWRYQALRDESYDYYFFRDADSRPIARERAVVAEYLASGQRFHTIRDHVAHGTPLLAGLWGCSRRGADRIVPILPKGPLRDFYGVDQEWLARSVWPIAKRDVYASVDCQWRYGTPVHSIPGDFSEGFIGAGFYGDDTPRFPEHDRGPFTGVDYG